MDPAVSDATVGRLPAYLRAAIDLGTQGVTSVSSDRLAEEAGAHPATLRRDLASLDITGTRGVGYDIKYLVSQISLVLGLNQQWPVVIVGAGNLGKALANYGGFAERGFPVAAMIDVSPELVGSTISGIPVVPTDELPRLVEEEDILVGIITTPADVAQEAADMLVEHGIRSILNFTTELLDVPPTVTCRSVDIATELQILSFYRQRGRAAQTGTGVPLGSEHG
ncbi:MAG: redox-sensing transcriptional repressor Rex [Acidimicrobiales bacterium]|nr:redox-sensing transcriptional repressor Rex [Acidimicrobiales bacterium]